MVFAVVRFICRIYLFAVKTSIIDRSYYFIICDLIFLVASVINFRKDSKRIENLGKDRFLWSEATIYDVNYFGGRRSHSRIYTDIGTFTTGQPIFGFRKDMKVIVIKYNINDDYRSLIKILMYIPDPIAYRISRGQD